MTYARLEDAYLDMVGLVIREGHRAVPRGLPTIEVAHPVHLTIADPTASFPLGATNRHFRNAITAGEAMSLVGQTSIPEVILDTVKAFRPFLNGSIFWGAYGPRIAGDLVNLVELIDRDPDTRQAVLTIFDSDRDLGRTKMADIPCTMTIQFRRRLNHLDMWVSMRSNDVWLGMPYDFGQFTILLAAVSQALGIRPGYYHHSVGSLHLYYRDREKAEGIRRDENMRREHIPIMWNIDAVSSADHTAVDRIGEISSRSRRLLMGDPLTHPTGFEQWIAGLLRRDVK